MPDGHRGSSLVVLHVNTQRGWRGGERQTLWLAEALHRLGHRSIVAARAGDELARRVSASGLELVEIDPAFEGDPRAAMTLRRTVREQRVDVVHAHAAHATGLSALALVRLDEPPLVVTRRMDIPLRANVGTRWKYGRVRAVIAISRAAAAALESSGVAAERIHIVPSGIDLDRSLTPAGSDTLAGIGIPEGVPLVVQVGQLAGDKDPVTFVRAMAAVRARVPDARGLLVGDGPLRPVVEREIAALGLGESVRLAGYRTDADALLAAADVVTLTSRREGLGSVLLDALAAGRPVVATNAGGIPDAVFEDETGFLVPTGDAAALGAAIANVLRDPMLSERLSAAALLRAQEFGMQSIAKRTLDVYRLAMAGTLSRSRLLA